MGLSGLPEDRLSAWVEASCDAQGVPAKVTDGAVLRRVVALLGGAADGTRAHARSASTRTDATRSQPPDRPNSLGVEAAGSGSSGGDDGVIQDGGNDGVGSFDGEVGPLLP